MQARKTVLLDGDGALVLPGIALEGQGQAAQATLACPRIALEDQGQVVHASIALEGQGQAARALLVYRKIDLEEQGQVVQAADEGKSKTTGLTSSSAPHPQV
mmetsp:Transcript_105752/g.210125  ORF Transcript_105752/g.210125 Transcript_105752/m.210125 type:complete len:102 (-) Transcript_105752:425-730(-)